MKFLLDANLPRVAAVAVVSKGHEAEHLRDTSLRDAPDEDVAAYALESGAVLVTRDMDFADARRYPPANYHGIVVLRLQDDYAAGQIADVLGRFLVSTDLVERLPGHLAIVEPARVRFRPAIF